jgi:hypothetical protein
MYALVEDNQVLLGPIGFNYRLINSVLEEELEIPNRVSSLDYRRVPFNITDNVRIIPAKNEEPFEFDPFCHIKTGPTVAVYDNEAVFTYSKQDKPLEQVKEEYKSLVSPVRKRKENEHINLTVNDTEIIVSLSRGIRASLTTKLISSDGPYNFKFSGDNWILVTKENLQYIVTKIDEKVQELFDWELDKKREIDTCTSVEEIRNVVINENLLSIE